MEDLCSVQQSILCVVMRAQRAPIALELWTSFSFRSQVEEYEPLSQYTERWPLTSPTLGSPISLHFPKNRYALSLQLLFYEKKIHISLLVSVVSGHCSQPLGLSPPPPSFDLMLISPRLVLPPEHHTPQLLWNRLHRRLGGKGKGVRAQHSKQLRNDWT